MNSIFSTNMEEEDSISGTSLVSFLVLSYSWPSLVSSSTVSETEASASVDKPMVQDMEQDNKSIIDWFMFEIYFILFFLSIF